MEGIENNIPTENNTTEVPVEEKNKIRKRNGWDDIEEDPDKSKKIEESTLTESQKMRLNQARAYIEIQNKKYEEEPQSIINSTFSTAFNKDNTGNEARTLSILCRIYVGSIFYDLTEQNIRSVFAPYGSIKSINLKIDPSTGKHNGYCFIDYDLPEAAFLAVEKMNGADFGGRKLKVGRPYNYDVNLLKTLPEPSPKRIYIANVNEYLTEEHLKSLFTPFGEIEQLALIPDPVTRKHKNCGFIEFKSEESATQAVDNMNNFVIGEQAFQVRKSIVGGPMPDGMKALDKIPVFSANIPEDVWKTANSINSNIAAVPNKNNTVNPAEPQLEKINKQEENMSLEENMSISASQRLSIMQKLARRDMESTVVLLENMVTANEIDEDLQSEITSECSKYGEVVKVVVWIVPESPSDEVRIFIQFNTNEAAAKANTELDGRYFGGRQLKAKLYDLEKFNEQDYAQ
ncbi:hypothetical protein BCR32DRAFT_268691 [Anaeromyces robustus]|uniref:RRM domain-containing protein n=1 Tax=Anaeromyces robustus TaxID=1754192 RepID=A0A1Y1X4I2_9FUNG|nr:hypothetical protein BCR32DRAFT_268691 [Anaeromyces robustus]|eukprot:ORX80721.1 hypothetical protein BCR32DRAFT_268691 [Anaeromyces robustus]